MEGSADLRLTGRPPLSRGGMRLGRPLTRREIVIRYIGFAVLAVACNLAAQRLVLAALRQGEAVAFGWAPTLLDWALVDFLGVLENDALWRQEVSAPLGLTVAICVGTLSGLVLKYVLDKRWIFFDRSHGTAAHARRFSLYAATGVVTTAIFWGAEAGAWAIWGTDIAREIGAALGLAVGYLAKYQFDRRLVFTPGLDDDAA